jgi:NAD(P)-dependent dehydrogenase (short-subunit alcohol dehydrogenase family)
MTVDNSSVFVVTGASRGLGLGLVSEVSDKNRIKDGLQLLYHTFDMSLA